MIVIGIYSESIVELDIQWFTIVENVLQKETCHYQIDVQLHSLIKRDRMIQRPLEHLLKLWA